MDNKNLLNEINKASFNTNKRFKKPEHSGVLNEIQSLIEQGKYENALALVENYLQKAPEHTELLISKGIALIALGRAKHALTALSKVSMIYENKLKEDDGNKIYLRNLSSAQANIALCHILLRDYTSAEKSALSARKSFYSWHAPHINLFTSYLRMKDEESLDSAIEEMVSTWPEWNSDASMSSHLHGDNSLTPDTDLIGLVERLTSLGYMPNSVKKFS